MNYLISFLLQIPVYFVVVSGLEALIGISTWWCVLICAVLMMSYDIGEMIRRGD